MIRTPSRWSSSCWTTRDAGGSSSSFERLALRVDALDRHRRRALDRHQHLAERETALVVDLALLRALRDPRIDQHAILAVRREDEDAAEDADLRRRQPDPVRLVHERRHALDQALEVVVEGLDLAGLHPQRRVAVLADAREREEPARLALEILLVVWLVVLVLVVLVLVVAVLVVGHCAASLARRAMAETASPRCLWAAVRARRRSRRTRRSRWVRCPSSGPTS